MQTEKVQLWWSLNLSLQLGLEWLWVEGTGLVLGDEVHLCGL